ncbi:MAG: PAS domain S-box protein [Burkholderiales bacterium]|nr:PAS domain S-box protein [Burkholderiales bacterium]
MLAIDHPHDRFQWAMLLASGVIISWVSDALLRSRERSRLRLQALDASHAALLASEARAQQLFDDAPVAMGLVAWDGRILSLNHQFTALFGYGSNDLRHIDDWWRLPHPDEAYRNELRRLWEMQQQGRPPPFIAEAAAEHRVLAANGRELTVQISRHPMDQGLLTTFVDITAAREAEKQLRLSTAALAQAQAQALEQMQALNATLETRVTERTRELAALNQSLESFVYSVSHDLKAPLRGVEGYSRFLLEDYGSQLGDEGRLFIGNIRAGVARMGELIDDLLAYSRMERRQLAREPVDLADLVAQVVAERAKEMAAGPVELQLDIAPLKVQADRDGLEMVLRNLLENAIKFTAHAPAPRITLTARRSDIGVELSVTDNGIGFDMKYHDRIFEIFQRLQRVEDYPGTGVGLALVKKAMDRMGGRVWAQSAPGQGASFHLELPLARSPS